MYFKNQQFRKGTFCERCGGLSTQCFSRTTIMMQKRMIAAVLLCCGYASIAQAAATPEKTEVIKYVPAIPTKTAEGSCWTSSIAASGSPYAWRCMTTENAIYDPCLTATDGQTIVCGVSDEEFALTLTEPLPEPDNTDVKPHPWRIELADGVICEPFTGTLPPIEETALYGCNDAENSALLEELQENGGLWQAKKVLIERDENAKDDELPFHITQETLVPILKLWFAGDPKETAQ